MSDPAAGGAARPSDHDARASYWEHVHHGKDVDGVSWWQSVPELSLGLVDQAALDPGEPVIDVGAGWSTLVDHLLDRGYRDLTAIDLSATALQTVRDRIGPTGAQVRLEVADVLDLRPDRSYVLWHDRAVYHFLTEPDERADYLASLERSLRPGGWAILATFGPDGPTTCSGLPIVRYTHADLAAQFPGYRLVSTAGEDHHTPWGTTQQFTAVLLQRPRTPAPPRKHAPTETVRAPVRVPELGDADRAPGGQPEPARRTPRRRRRVLPTVHGLRPIGRDAPLMSGRARRGLRAAPARPARSSRPAPGPLDRAASPPIHRDGAPRPTECPRS